MSAVATVLDLPVERPAVDKWVVTGSIAFGSLMAAIDTSIVNVALPQIRGAVGATLEEITWVSTAYIIATVLVMPLTGFLGSFFGQKRVYLASLVLFVIGSALCGVARSLPALVAYRALQGFGAGALQPTQHRKSRGWRWRCSPWSSWSALRSARRSEASSSTTTAGRGSSTSTCRSGSSARS